MTNEQKATALKELVDTLAQEGDQWLLEEPFAWEKRPQWVVGDVTPWPIGADISPTKAVLKAATAIDEIVKNTVFEDMFACVFREGEMMILSIPSLYDIMVPFHKKTEVYLSKGPKSLFTPGMHQPYYDVFPKSKLWINGEAVDPEDTKGLTEAGLRVLGQRNVDGGIASRCQGKHPVVCVRQEGFYTHNRPGGWPVHGPVWVDPTCIFYKV